MSPVGSTLLSETERTRVWIIRLAPGERIGFHRHVLDYFWTSVSGGRGRQHVHDGTTVEYTYEFVIPPTGSPVSRHPLLALRGSWKDIFQALGGGEAFLKRERAHFDEADGPDEEETRR